MHDYHLRYRNSSQNSLRYSKVLVSRIRCFQPPSCLVQLCRITSLQIFVRKAVPSADAEKVRKIGPNADFRAWLILALRMLELLNSDCCHSNKMNVAEHAVFDGNAERPRLGLVETLLLACHLLLLLIWL